MNLKLNMHFFNGIVWSYISRLSKFKSKNIILVLSLMVFTSFTEGISILLLVPLLQLVGLNVQQGVIAQISEYTALFFTYIKITPTLTIVLLFYVFVVSLNACIHRFQFIETSKIQYEFGAHIRKSLFSKIAASNWIFFTRNKSSDFAHALTNEVERVSIGTGQFLTFLASIMILIVYMFFALKLAGFSTGVIFIVGMGCMLLLRNWVSKSKTTGEEVTHTTKELYSLILQNLDGMKTIKSFGMENENINIFSNQTISLAKSYLNSIKSYADVKLLFNIGTIIVLAILVLVIIEIIKLPLATLILLIYIFVRTIPQFSTIQYSYQFFINMLPAFANVSYLEKQCMENPDHLETEECKISYKKIMRLKNVSFSYRNEDCFIKDLNLQIPFGKTVAIVGSSGAGKSTLVDIIMGLTFPSKGELTVDGVLISDCINGWRSQIGYVSQETFLFNETIKSNLLISHKKANETEIIESLKLAAAYEFVSKLPEGINTVVGDRGIKLSGGERQRLSLARALLRNPTLLVLDEATSNLDSKNERKILNAIEDLHGDMTILIIAHRLSTIKNADLIYLLNEGQIIESGTWEDLLKNKDHFWDIWNTQKC